MRELTLYAAPVGDPAAVGALWSGRSNNAALKPIEEVLAEHLLEIRAEHMQWAFQTGLLPMGDRTFAEQLACGDEPSMWWTSLLYERHPKLSPNLYIIYKLRCVEILLEQEDASGLRLVGGSPKLAASLSDLCGARGLTFNHEFGPEQAEDQRPLKQRVYEALPAPARALLRFGHWWLTIRRRLPYAPELAPPPPAGAATIATYFPNIDLQAAGEGRFRSRYWENLHTLLNEEAQAEGAGHFVRWLFIRFPSPDLGLGGCIRLRDIFQKRGADGLSFKFLEEYLAPGDLPRALWRWAKIAIRSFTLERKFRRACQTKNSRLNFWPQLKYQWRESLAGWRCLERCLHDLAFRNYARAAGRQRFNLFPLENCPWERMFTLAARQIKGNGRVIGAQHSAIRPTDFRYFDAPETFTSKYFSDLQPDIIAGNGASACGQWLANQMPVARLRQVEALRYLYLAKADRCADSATLPPQPGEPQKPGPGKKLLILTSFFRDEVDAHLALVSEALEAGLLEGWAITLKPHPYLMPEEWLQGLKDRDRNRIFVSHAPLATELLPYVTVWASNSTTASLEAAIRHLPLMVMAPANDFDLCPIQDAPGLWRTASTKDVRQFLADPRPFDLPRDYLNLSTDLRAWRELLDLNKACGPAAKEGNL